MAQYRQAKHGEEADILDFINYVFSQASRPHDFARLLPKVYARDDFAQYHYVAEEGGRIRATVAMLPSVYRVDDARALSLGYIGSVSSHPYDRGKGHMQALMRLALADADARGIDLLALGGMRQRYGYFGFECGGGLLRFAIYQENIRHALRDVRAQAVRIREVSGEDDGALEAAYALYLRQPLMCRREREGFLPVMRSFGGRLYVIEDADAGADAPLLGYLSTRGEEITELALADESRVGQVLKRWIEQQGARKVALLAPMSNRVRANFVKSFAEGYSVSDGEMICVRDWKKVLSALLSYKADCLPLADGRFTFEIEGAGRWVIEVAQHAARVTSTDGAPDVSFNARRAVEFFFSPFTALSVASPMLKSWLPLPFGVPVPDQF